MDAVDTTSNQSIAPQRWRSVLRLLRPHQWAKNLLLFLPLLTAHKLGNWHLVLQAVTGFVAFSLCASAVYVFNDLRDVDDDRRHPRKRMRPFASAALPLSLGSWLAPLLICAALALALWLPLRFLYALIFYVAVTTLYSLWWRRVAILDVSVLAGLYTLRLIAGACAIIVPVSFWLLAFSMFLFTSLALVKRYTELIDRNSDEHATVGTTRGYFRSDAPILAACGVGTGLIAVLVLALYIDSPDIAAQYQHIHRLWLVCPLLLYWVTRVWLISHRGAMHDDPIVFALTDRVSLALCALMGLLLLSAL